MSEPAKLHKTNSSILAVLERTLSDSYLLGLKTHGFHSNVEGPTFQ